MKSTNGAMTTSFEDSVDQLKGSFHDLTQLGSERVNDIKDRVINAKTVAVSKAEGFLAKTKAMIVENPLAAVGIAFGVGYVAMRVLRR